MWVVSFLIPLRRYLRNGKVLPSRFFERRQLFKYIPLDQSLTSEQKAKLVAMRQELLGDLSHPTGAYLYSELIVMSAIPSSDFLFK